MNKFDKFKFKYEAWRQIYDDEILLSFMNAKYAQEFRRWLDSEGLELFQEYLDKNK